MKGFGKEKKPAKKQVSKKHLRMPPEQLKALAIKNHMKGNINAAEKGYQSFISSGLNDADVLSNYGLICQEKGAISEAIKIFEKCINLFPNHSIALSNLGYLYLTIERIEEAEITTKKAIEVQPGLSNAHSILGLILNAQGRMTEAEDSILKAIKLDPMLADAHLNHGVILKDQNKWEEAEIATRKAINLNPDMAIAYLNLGALLQQKNRLEEAHNSTLKAIELQPNLEDAHLNIATILQLEGNYEEAINHAKQELDVSPLKQDAYILLSSLIKECDLSVFSIDQIIYFLSLLLKRKDIDHNNLFPAIRKIVPDKRLFDLESSEGPIIDDARFQTIIKNKVIIQALGIMTFKTTLWEDLLTKARKEICHLAIRKTNRKSTVIIDFTIALAEQCFLNEYVFYKDNDEEEYLTKIIQDIENSIFDEFSISILACYMPIYKIPNLLPLLKEYKSRNINFNSLIKLQLEEPMEENKMAPNIKSIGSIKDKVSKEVRSQYEEHPYPRWRFASYTANNKQSLNSSLNREIYPNNISKASSQALNRILVAGCGTGRQLIDTSGYKNAEITAIDLSLSSLAYAQRKINEYGINNIELIHMDILDIPSLGKSFDLIECSGVLHHMKEPEEGLRSLIKVLSRNGYIKLGLYSEAARAEIVEARRIIKSEKVNTTDDSIRDFRHRLAAGDFPEIKSINQWSDYYSTSMCRDLCFHVQEHRYSINSLKKILNKFDLNFLGFVLPKPIKDNYAKLYPDDSNQLNLNNWHEFELSNRSTFAEMYQFWIEQKKT